MRWTDRALDDSLIAHTTVTRALDMACLTTRRDDTLIVVAYQWNTSAGNDTGVWRALHDSMAHALRRGIGSIGVGGLAEVANQVPRSYRQALQTLRVRTGSFALSDTEVRLSLDVTVRIWRVHCQAQRS